MKCKNIWKCVAIGLGSIFLLSLFVILFYHPPGLLPIDEEQFRIRCEAEGGDWTAPIMQGGEAYAVCMCPYDDIEYQELTARSDIDFIFEYACQGKVY